MVSALVPGLRCPGFEPWPGTLCCILGQGTCLLHCLSPPRSRNGYRRLVGEPEKLQGVTCNGLEILLAASWYRNWDKIWQL